MFESEELLTLAQAAALLPKTGKRKTHVSTLWRWARRGYRGHKLEIRQFGRRVFTSIPALDRFAKALAAIELPEPAPRKEATERTRTQLAREHAAEKARERLRRQGV